MENKHKEKMDAQKMELETEIKRLRGIKLKLEDTFKTLVEQNKEMAERIKSGNLSRPKPEKSTGPSVPDRPMSVRFPSGPLKLTGSIDLPPLSTSGSKPLPIPPPKRSESKEKVSDTEETQHNDYNYEKQQTIEEETNSSRSSNHEKLTSMEESSLFKDKKEKKVKKETFVAVPSRQESSSTIDTQKYASPWDIWEGTTKLVVAIDVPGVEVDFLDISISRFKIDIAQKLGAFEEKFLSSKYKPVHLNRLELQKKGASKINKFQIVLPSAIEKVLNLYHHHGTVYVHLQKLSEVSLRPTHWGASPSF